MYVNIYNLILCLKFILEQYSHLKTEFGKNSLLYDEARPSYPSLVIDDIIKISGIPENGLVLDVGCGPGRAAILFGERGYRVVGVDISAEMVELARQKSSELPKVSYVVGEFEQADLPEDQFDLIVAGSSLHWIEPDQGYKKIADLLNDSGTLSAFWNFENYGIDGLAVTVSSLYREHCPAFPPDLGSPKRYIQKLDACGLFEPLQINTYFWNWELTKEKYIKLARSWAWVSSLPETGYRTFMNKLETLLKDQPEHLVMLTTAKSQSSV